MKRGHTDESWSYARYHCFSKVEFRKTEYGDYMTGNVYTIHGIVDVYGQGYDGENIFANVQMILNGRFYKRSFKRIMRERALARAAHKFARDVAEGRVK